MQQEHILVIPCIDPCNVLKGKTRLFQSRDLMNHCHLTHGIISIAVLLIDVGRHQQSLRLVKPEGLDRHTIHCRKHPDFI